MYLEGGGCDDSDQVVHAEQSGRGVAVDVEPPVAHQIPLIEHGSDGTHERIFPLQGAHVVNLNSPSNEN